MAIRAPTAHRRDGTARVDVGALPGEGVRVGALKLAPGHAEVVCYGEAVELAGLEVDTGTVEGWAQVEEVAVARVVGGIGEGGARGVVGVVVVAFAAAAEEDSNEASHDEEEDWHADRCADGNGEVIGMVGR